MDPIADLESVARRRRLMEAMAQQASGAGIKGTKYQLGQALAQLGTHAVNAYNRNKLDGQEKEARAEYGTQLQDELRAYEAKSAGVAPGINIEAAQEALGNKLKPDRRGAVMEAMTSRLPEMQKIGQAGAQELGKKPEGMSQKDWLSLNDFTPTSRVAASLANDPRLLKGQKKLITAADQIFDQDALEGGPVVDARMRYGKPTILKGDLYQPEDREGGLLKKLDNASKTTVSVTPQNYIAAQNSGMAEWSKLAAKAVDEMAMQARGARKAVDSLGQIERLTKSGTFDGPTANPAIWMGQLFNAAGIPMKVGTQQALNNSETFGNVSTELWMQFMNSVGGARGLVKEESEKIANSLPSLVQTPAGRLQIVQFMRQVAGQTMADARQAQQEYSRALRAENPELFTFGLSQAQIPRTEDGPVNPGAVAGRVLTLDEYLKQAGVR